MYETKQRRLLLNFLSSHIDESLSVKQIIEALKQDMSSSAVYRNLAQLEKQNFIKRTSKIGNRMVFFKYIDTPECRESLHLSCKKCGKTYHMKETGADKLIRSVSEIEGFDIDKTETVLYGVCEKCRSN